MATDYERAIALLTGKPDPGASIEQFLQQAKTSLKLDEATPLKVSDDDDIVDAADPDTINAIVARAEDARRRRKEADAEYAELIGLLKAAVGEHDGVQVHGAVVFTYKRSRSRILNQSFVKSRFPDIEGNEDFWTDSERRTALLK